MTIYKKEDTYRKAEASPKSSIVRDRYKLIFTNGDYNYSNKLRRKLPFFLIGKKNNF